MPSTAFWLTRSTKACGNVFSWPNKMPIFFMG
jgi:hypothetical protein